MPDTQARFAVNVQWLLTLRWVAVVGQLLTFGFATVVLGIEIVVWPVIVILGLTAISNLLLTRYLVLARHPEMGKADPLIAADRHILGLVMTMDMLSLTTLLFVSGGPTNPFWVFYLVNVSLSAVLLDREWAWGLNLLANVCSCGLFFHFVQIPELDQGPALAPILPRGSISLVQIGMMAGFAACSSVMVYFVTRVTGALRQQESDLRLAQQQQSRSEKIQALGTLAAGAAHELATPLTTIAIVARDVEQALRKDGMTGNHGALIEDVGLIRQQLDRCKRILDRMASHSGESVGEMVRTCDLAKLASEICEGLGQAEQRIVIRYNGDRHAVVRLPVVAFCQAIRGLVQNGLDASEPPQQVTLALGRTPDALVIAVEDQGHGMSGEVLARVSEPFFTTKQPGKGMGLGVFLARNVVEQMGGKVRIESRTSPPDAAAGTSVFVTIPQPALEAL